jgi:SOS-response transcriptional repressor LexA
MHIENFSQKLESILSEKKLSQTALANMMGVTARHLSRVKKSEDIPEKFFEKLCSALNISPRYFAQGIEPELNQGDYYPVPFRDAGGGMGGGYSIASRQTVSHISLRRDFLRRKTNNLEKLSFIHASGDSMSPTIPTDAAVLIDEGQTEPINNKIFFVMLNGEYYIKRLEVEEGEVVALISDNSDYPKIVLTEFDYVEILGRALLQQAEL